VYQANQTASRPGPWNKGKLVGQKAPLKLKHIWTIRVRLELADRARELALFNLAFDSKLRSCDLLKLRVRDVYHGDRVAPRAIILQQKTQRPVQFEITEQTRDSLSAWIRVGPKTGSVHGLTVQPAEIGLITRVADLPSSRLQC
jgi:integrase